ncbi:hypothetical protein [Roseateles asaccharophilus]|uniref:Right handed beta helix domain-containing protein n=1 Tax=Roseateles asaccharophilus TaxID=582607 RepID=A0ABU2A3K8_9BURK|nr:hypothetical protein [Roseateles asaccharophilus]MDR7331774.1 hypothetical protein [Roseateles asaccharophilus]
MRSYFMGVLLALAAACHLAGCGGGAAGPLPEAQAAAPTDACPTGDATAQLQAMVDAARGQLELPACVFNTSAPIVIARPLRLVGAGATVDGTIIRTTAAEGLVVDPAVRISVAMAPNKRGWWGSVEQLRIEPALQGGGKHALVLRVRPGFFINNWLVDRVHLGDFGEQGLLLDNSAGNVDGIFTGLVARSFIENGVKAVLIGDSVAFSRLVVTNGPSRFSGPGLPGFDISTVDGAAESVIEWSNITTAGGCVQVRNGQGIGILHNWCESARAPAGTGLITLANCLDCAVRENRVQTLSGEAAWALVLDGSQRTVIDSNKLNPGTAGHIAFRNGASQNKLSGLNRFYGGADVLAGKFDGAAAGLLATP